jgi:hypothetical protein
MTMQFSRLDLAARQARPRAGSSLVRRLVWAQNDPAKERIHGWLKAMDDERLLDFGLSRDDIALLRR